MDSLDFWVEMSPRIEHMEDDIKSWINTHTNMFEEDHIEEFIDQLCSYVLSEQRKTTEKFIRDKMGKTYNERVSKAKKYIGKLGLELIKFPTKKGRVLMDMLEDMAKHPEEYLHNTTNTKANLDEVDIFLSHYKVSKEARTELLNIIKN